MKNKILLLCLGFWSAISGFSQPITNGAWSISTFPNDIFRITWEYKNMPRTEQVSNAVILKSDPQAASAMKGEKLVFNGKDFAIEPLEDNQGIQIVIPDKTLSILNGFDSGHVRGVKIAMPENISWYGGGERALPLIRNGQRIPLYNAPAYGYGEGQDQLNYSVPFIFSTSGFGIFFDNPSKGYLDFGKTLPDILEAGFESGRLDLYIIPGENPETILGKYALLTGKQPLPPRWALGNFVSRFGYQSQQQAETVVQKMKADGFPMDAIIIDLFWFGETIQYTLGNLDWNKKKWPEPEKMIAGFAKDNIKTILITEPFFLENTNQYKASHPFLATDSLGKPFVLTDFYFGKGGIIDIFQKPARDWFWQFYRKQNKLGVAGWWGDLGEPENHPQGVYHNLSDYGSQRKMSANEVHNMYGHVWSQMVYENWKKDQPDKRLFFLNRAGFAGSQRFSIFPWTGDVGRSWSGFRAQIPLLQSMSMSGVPYIHSDAGGFAMTDTADAELYTRWLQFAAYTPVFRPHGSALDSLTPDGTISLPSEPAFWDAQTKAHALQTIQERYRLLPYNYSLAWEQTHFGKPLIRPMVYAWPEDEPEEIAKATEQYMWGPSLLVAPVTERGATTKRLYLPAGSWFRYNNLRKETGSQWIEEPTTADHIPVFIKGGSFLPYWDKETMQSTQDYNWNDTLTIRYFPGNSDKTFYIYDDDGVTPDADKEKEKHQLMSWKSSIQQRNFTLKGTVENWPSGQKRIFKFQLPVNGMELGLGKRTTPIVFTLNGKEITPIKVQDPGKEDSWWVIYCEATGDPIEITIRK